MSTILAERLILNAWLGPGCASAVDVLQFLKSKQRYSNKPFHLKFKP